MKVERLALVSGVWSGHYVERERAFPQRMTIELADGLVRGDGVDDLGTFTLDGEYRVDGASARLGWVKTYDGAHSVLYLGELRDEVITGSWSIGSARGTFRLEAERRAEG